MFLRTVAKARTTEHSQGKKIPRLQQCCPGIFLFIKTFRTFVFFSTLRYNVDEEAEEMIFQLVKQMAKDEGDEAILTCKQLETLEKYDEAMNEMHSLAEVEAFSYGFRIGVRLMIEALIKTKL